MKMAAITATTLATLKAIFSQSSYWQAGSGVYRDLLVYQTAVDAPHRRTMHVLSGVDDDSGRQRWH
jgi:hypothetical protein